MLEHLLLGIWMNGLNKGFTKLCYHQEDGKLKAYDAPASFFQTQFG
jgi:hypothetical protein